MSVSPEEAINTFINMDSIPDEAKDELRSLKSSLKYAAPELISERLFLDFKSQPGLCSILSRHAPENQEAGAEYMRIIQSFETRASSTSENSK